MKYNKLEIKLEYVKGKIKRGSYLVFVFWEIMLSKGFMAGDLAFLYLEYISAIITTRTAAIT